ncbi:SPOR domain-containing protein [Undibacterium sp. SXout7W]|uniref:SPOR domain-containing protein n=1 Tax=Undibacterium sp. SXout7W TaxID=3413049 RepID=UPI003BF0A599
MGLLSRFKKKQETSDHQDSGVFRSRAEEDSLQSRTRTKKAEPSRKNKANDPILPEKKRARRRLIGAVALALAAIVGLPMVLDSEPKQLADDINIKIPSKDKSSELAAQQQPEAPLPRKNIASDNEPVEEIIEPAPEPTRKPTFSEIPANQPKTAAPVKNVDPLTVVNLQEKQPKPEQKSDSKPVIKPEAKTEKADSKSELKVESKTESKTDIKHEAKQDSKPAKPVEKDTAAVKSEHKSEAKSESRPEPAKPAKAVTSDDDAARALAILEGKAPPKPLVAKPENTEKSSYIVQAGAFSTQSKVDEIQSKLNAANIRSYTQKIVTSSGEITRIRIGPFASKEEAEKMRAKLSKLGMNASLPPN